MKILVAIPTIPKPDMSAGDRRLFEILKILSCDHEVIIWTRHREPDLPAGQITRYKTDLEALGIHLCLWPMNFRLLMASHRFQMGFFSFYWVAENVVSLFRRAQPGAGVIVDSVDVHFAREEIAAGLGIGSAKAVIATKERELAAYKSADAVIVVSDDERNLLKREQVCVCLVVVPIIVSVTPYPNIGSGNKLVFVGSFDWPPNQDGILWFVKEIWPSIRENAPTAELDIIGSNPKPTILALNSVAGVNVLGYVSDTLPYLQRADISIAPLRYGGGMKGKVNEAMAAGLPVVTTSIGAQGLKAISGQHLMVEDEPERFARAVVRLLHDPVTRRAIGKAGQNLTANLCSPETAAKEIKNLITTVQEMIAEKHVFLGRIRYLFSFGVEAAIAVSRPAWWSRRLRRALSTD